MPTRALKVPMWFWVTRCTLSNDYSAKTDLIFIYGSCFGLLGIWKSSFWAMLCSITPLLRVQVPLRSPYGLKPLISCIASPTNQRTDLFCEFGSFFFSFSPFSNLFGHVFWLFLTPLYAYMCVKGLHLDLNSEFYHLSLESEKKRTLIIDYFNFFNFFSNMWWFLLIWGPVLAPSWGSKYPQGPRVELYL